MKQTSILKPLRFKFTEPSDVQQFGDDWHVYDEAQIVRLPARDLVKLEMQLGMPILNVLQGMRDETALGYLGGSWLALRQQNPDLAGEFDDYGPAVLLIDWARIPDPDLPKGDLSVPLDSTTSPSTPPPE